MNIWSFFIRWFKNSKLLENQKKYQIDCDLQTGMLMLTIKRAGKVDLGHYECEVRPHLCSIVIHCIIESFLLEDLLRCLLHGQLWIGNNLLVATKHINKP